MRTWTENNTVNPIHQSFQLETEERRTGARREDLVCGIGEERGIQDVNNTKSVWRNNFECSGIQPPLLFLFFSFLYSHLPFSWKQVNQTKREGERKRREKMEKRRNPRISLMKSTSWPQIAIILADSLSPIDYLFQMAFGRKTNFSSFFPFGIDPRC